MSFLSGTLPAEEIKKEHTQQVAALRKVGIHPKLFILHSPGNPVIELYIRLKKKYGEAIGVHVESFELSEDGMIAKLQEIAHDASVHGVIVQLPLLDTTRTEEVLSFVPKEKDVDGLRSDSLFVPATPKAILTLLEKNAVSLSSLPIVIVGRGKLVGAPLSRFLTQENIPHTVLEKENDLTKELAQPSIIITATGVPGSISNDMIVSGSVLVDAGTAVEKGELLGDADPELMTREDIQITPKKGGVGPLTVCSLFDNVLIGIQRKLEEAQ